MRQVDCVLPEIPELKLSKGDMLAGMVLETNDFDGYVLGNSVIFRVHFVGELSMVAFAEITEGARRSSGSLSWDTGMKYVFRAGSHKMSIALVKVEN